MSTVSTDAEKRVAALERKLERERMARAETERIAEKATTRLYAMVRDLEMFEHVLEIIPDPLFMIDLDYTPKFMNAAARRLFLGDAKSEEPIESLNLTERYPRWSLRLLEEVALPVVFERGAWRGELTMLRADGLEIPVSHDVVRHTVDDRPCLTVLVRDLSESKAVEAELRTAAYVDPVSGLPNRRAAIDDLANRLRQEDDRHESSSVGVISLGIEGMKDVAANYGHDVSNRLLIAIADRVQSVLRPGDVLARLGPSEFAILCNLGVDGPGIIDDLVGQVFYELTRPFGLHGRHHTLSAYAGAALTTFTSTTAEALLRDADIAGARARSQGRFKFSLFDPSLRITRISQMEIEQELHQAVNHDQLRAFFQPIVSTRTGMAVGHEALLRWIHPTRGMISPATFVPIAEENGQIVEIGRWVTRKAVEQLSAWNALRDDEPLYMSVNLSPRQFVWPGLLPYLKSLVETMSDPSLLQMEITETAAMGDPRESIARVREIRELGIQVAIDDFGTGYSSMTYLKDMQADTLKIDRAFVRDLFVSEQDRAIATAIVELARALDMKVVAEGVENDEQLGVLTEMGVAQVQGFWFSQPGPPEQFAANGDFMFQM
ncbi:MAG: EAL domain-containing protein [Acidimicrobiales bacterium]